MSAVSHVAEYLTRRKTERTERPASACGAFNIIMQTDPSTHTPPRRLTRVTVFSTFTLHFWMKLSDQRSEIQSFHVDWIQELPIHVKGLVIPGVEV